MQHFSDGFRLIIFHWVRNNILDTSERNSVGTFSGWFHWRPKWRRVRRVRTSRLFYWSRILIYIDEKLDAAD